MLIPETVWQELQDTSDIRIRNDYSGRGMYGEKCAAIIGSDPMYIGAVLFQLMGEEAFQVIKQARSDSLGYDTVVYFPGSTFDNFVDEEEDDDEG